MDFIYSIDFAILDRIQEALRNAVLDPVMMILSYLGEAGAVWLIASIIMLFFKKTRATAVIMLAAMAVTFLTGDLLIKHIVARVRPCHIKEIVMNVPKPSSFSFPSGHASIAFTCTTVLLARHGKYGIPALILAVLIAFSRLYNYVHFPSDVLCGAVFGVLCALLIMFIFKKTGLENRLSPHKAKSE